MAVITTLKTILPTPTEFVRWLSRAMLFNQRAQRDTSIVLTPRVSRALLLVNKTGLIIAQEEKDDGNG